MSNSFFRMRHPRSTKRMVIVHGLIAPFLEVIMLAIILLLVGLTAPLVLIITTGMIVALIVSMTIISLLVVVIASVS